MYIFSGLSNGFRAAAMGGFRLSIRFHVGERRQERE
jgi:hypothetical protein